jgi:atypical dual specificity phosphatase
MGADSSKNKNKRPAVDTSSSSSTSSGDDATTNNNAVSPPLTRPNWRASEILEGRLYLSELPGDEQVDRLKSQGFTHILNVTDLESSAEDVSVFAKHFKYLRVNIADMPDVPILEHFPSCNNFLDEAMDSSEGKALVHCQAGVSRSPSVVIAYLMYKNKLTLSEAYNFVIARRTYIKPNFGFMHQLCLYEQQLRGADSDFFAEYVLIVLWDLKAKGITKEEVSAELKKHDNWTDALDVLLKRIGK